MNHSRNKRVSQIQQKSLARGVYEKGLTQIPQIPQISRRLIEKVSQITQITQNPSGWDFVRMASV